MGNDIKTPLKITADDLEPRIPIFCPICRKAGKEVKIITRVFDGGDSWVTECPDCGALFDED